MNLLDTVFKLSLYGLTAFSGCILGAAENQSWQPYATLPFVVVGYLWCEVRGRARESGLSEVVASVCGFLALTVATNEFFGGNPEGKLLAGTHMMVYLTWIVLLQAKTAYRCWLLLALGVLQVAVSSVLTNGGWFGGCTIGYLFASVWTLSVFSLHRAEVQFAASAADTAASPGETSLNSLDALPMETAHDSTGLYSQAFSSVQHESDGRWLTVGFAGGVVFTSVAGLIVSALFFALVPRVWVGAPTVFSNDDLPSLKRRAVSGFSSEVRLGDMGTILESVEPVLELRIFDQRTGGQVSPLSYADRLGLAEPMFRGAVLSTYGKGRWATVNIKEIVPQRFFPNVESQSVRQEIRLEPIGSTVLFCLGRPKSLTDERSKSGGLYDWLTDLPYRGPDFPKSGVLEYSVRSEMPSQRPAELPGLKVSPEILNQYKLTGYLERNLEVPGGLQRLKGLAQQLVLEAQQREGRSLDTREVARLLEQHLLSSGVYGYSLDQSITDATIDPLEDFLFNRREGHCEYFASALTLMLRSQGIPARLITGFKGGLLHGDGSLRVQQRYAHAWVEAWLGSNTWVMLDGTPEQARLDSMAEVAARGSFLTGMSSALSGMWSENVVNITFDRQKELFYTPLRELALSIWSALQSLWPTSETSVASILAALIDPRNWFSPAGGVTLALLLGFLWLLRHRPRWFRWPWRGWEQTEPAVAERWVEFYERFVSLMGSRGLHRTPTQTQLEFAVHSAESLNGELQAAELDGVPRAVSEFFYRVRFGDETLTDEDAAQIESQLTHLERALDHAREHRATRIPAQPAARNGSVP